MSAAPKPTPTTSRDPTEERWPEILSCMHDLIDEQGDGRGVPSDAIERRYDPDGWHGFRARVVLAVMEKRGLVRREGRCRDISGAPWRWLPVGARLRVVRVAYDGPEEPAPERPWARTERVTERNPVGSAYVAWLCRLVDRGDRRVMGEGER